jgi:hypothetical protein
MRSLALLLALAGTPLPALPPSMVGTVTEEVAELEIGAIYFASGSADLPAADALRLADFGRKLADLPLYVLVEAHTDAAGDAEENRLLSERRAAAAARAIADGTGFPPSQTLAIGYGEADARGATPDEMARERRVVMRVLRRRGLPPERAQIVETLRVRGVRFTEVAPPSEAPLQASSVSTPPAPTRPAAHSAALGLLLHGAYAAYDEGSGAGGGVGLRVTATGWRVREGLRLAFDAATASIGGERAGSPGKTNVTHAGLGLAWSFWTRRYVDLALHATAGMASREFVPIAGGHGSGYRVTEPAGTAHLYFFARHPKLPLGVLGGPYISGGSTFATVGASLGMCFLILD